RKRRKFVKQTKAMVLTLVIMVLALFGLYACGGETPTATPVPPTATAVPPTATTAPATPTTAAAAPTDTAVTAAVATATTSSTSGNGGNNASADDIAAIQAALASAKDLTSYHFIAQAPATDVITQPVNLEGDYVAPNTAYFKGTI